MSIEIERRGEIAILKPTGHLTGGADNDLIKAIRPLIEQRGARVVLDLGGVEYVSSAGLGDLVRITAQANSQSARVVLAQPAPFVAGVLATTRLDRFFEIAPDIETAIKKLGGTT